MLNMMHDEKDAVTWKVECSRAKHLFEGRQPFCETQPLRPAELAPPHQSHGSLSQLRVQKLRWKDLRNGANSEKLWKRWQASLLASHFCDLEKMFCLKRSSSFKTDHAYNKINVLYIKMNSFFKWLFIFHVY